MRSAIAYCVALGIAGGYAFGAWSLWSYIFPLIISWSAHWKFFVLGGIIVNLLMAIILRVQKYIMSMLCLFGLRRGFIAMTLYTYLNILIDIGLIVWMWCYPSEYTFMLILKGIIVMVTFGCWKMEMLGHGLKLQNPLFKPVPIWKDEYK